MRYLGGWRTVLAAGTLAFLVFLARGWLDWRFVFSEFTADDDIATTFIAILFYTAVCAVWIWALVATGRERRGGAIGVLVLSLLLLVVGGIATFAALALERGATLATSDRDFARFTRLRLVDRSTERADADPTASSPEA